jgi:GntR family transcriptional regulator
MNTVLDRNNATPLYEQLAAQLRAEIEAGQFDPSGKLPSESELVNSCGVSRVTVRLALDLLAREGAVERQQGKGTYVSGRRLRHPLNALLSFHEALLAQGVEARISTVSCRREPVPQALHGLFGADSEACLVLRRLHSAGAEPVALATSYLPIALETVDWDATPPRPVYAVLEATLGITVQRADLSIRASAADAAVANVLGLATGSPLLEMERDSFDDEGRWRDHSLFQIRPERYEFSVSSASRMRLGTMKRQSTG